PLRRRVRQVVVEHALVAPAPRLAAVGRLEHARGRDRDEDAVAVAWIDHDRVDARRELAAFGGGRTEPMRDAGALAREEITAARRVVPERPVEREALAAVVALEEAAGDGADVDLLRSAEGDAPQLEERGVLEGRLLRVVLAGDGAVDVAGALGVGDLRSVFPGRSLVARPRELRAPVPVAEERPERAVVRVARHVV